MDTEKFRDFLIAVGNLERNNYWGYLEDNPKNNIYVSILGCLSEKYGARHKEIINKLKDDSANAINGKNRVTLELKRLINKGFISYNEGRYYLTNEGKEVYENLIEPMY
jgi:predicted transcriptional regulator